MKEDIFNASKDWRMCISSSLNERITKVENNQSSTGKRIASLDSRLMLLEGHIDLLAQKVDGAQNSFDII